MNLKCELLDHQKDFIQSSDHYLAMFGGYGSGKTHGLILKLLSLCSRNKGIPGGLVCPTIKMFKRDVLPLLRSICEENDIDYNYHRQDSELYIPMTNSRIYIFHGEDGGQSIRGPNLGWLLLNEATLLDWDTFKAAIGRVRLKHAPYPQIALSGTPEDFNWAYDKFIDKPMPNSKVIYADTRKNRFTADWYISMLTEGYDDIALQQYVEGKFVPTTGQRALYKFDRMKHVTDNEVRTGRGEIWAHVDFNVYPMAATIYEYVPDNVIPLRAFDEVCIHGADTRDLCRVLVDKIGHKNVVLFPDPAGVARKTSAVGGITDISILRDYGFTELRYKTSLRVRDCLNAANNLLSKDKVLIHSSCRETIRDFERVKLKHGTSELDKSDPERTHWLDGFKNMADYEFPIVKSYTEVTGRKIR